MRLFSFPHDSGRDHHPDCYLIARSMLEGLSQLYWTAQDAQTRATRWRTYAYVHDWRLLNRRADRGEPADDAHKRRIDSVLSQSGAQFVHPRHRKSLDAGKPVRDPYDDRWSGETVRAMFEAAGGLPLYLEMYPEFSDWHHWNVSGFAHFLSWERHRVRFSRPSARREVHPLNAAYHSLYDTLRVSAKHFGLTIDSHLRYFHLSYLGFMAPTLARRAAQHATAAALRGGEGEPPVPAPKEGASRPRG